MYLFALLHTVFFKLSVGNGCQINHIKFCTRFISSQSKQQNRPVLPNDGRSTFVMISCTGIQQLPSK